MYNELSPTLYNPVFCCGDKIPHTLTKKKDLDRHSRLVLITAGDSF